LIFYLLLIFIKKKQNYNFFYLIFLSVFVFVFEGFKEWGKELLGFKKGGERYFWRGFSLYSNGINVRVGSGDSKGARKGIWDRPFRKG
jgi:hypothetical protein